MKKLALLSVLFFSMLFAGEYSIIAFSTKKFNLKYAKQFIKRFPNGVVKQYTRFVEYKIEPFKDYKSAKRYLKYVKKYYKHPLIIKYNPNLGKILYPLNNAPVQKTVQNKPANTHIKKPVYTYKPTKKEKTVYKKRVSNDFSHCPYECGNGDYPWEINNTRVLNDINVTVPSYLKISSNSVVSAGKNAEIKELPECYTPQNELLFYTDFYGDIYDAQKLNGYKLKGNTLNAKLGLMYTKGLNRNWKFYTDDRIILSTKYRNTERYNDIYFDINELYIRSYCLYKDRFNILIGRKKTKDDRSWLYDSSLDQIRFFSENYLLNYKLIFATRINDETVTDDNSAKAGLKHFKYVIFNPEYEFYYQNKANVYLIYQKYEDTSAYIGALSVKGISGGVLYWVSTALSKGDRPFDSLKDATGGAIDAGVKIASSEPLNYGIGFAYGSKNYIQPYSATNYSDYLHKGFSVRYYGEIFDPYLQNLEVLSLYGDYKLHDNGTFFAAFHNYRQPTAKQVVYNDKYLFASNGKSKNLGNEIDLFYQYRIKKLRKLKAGFAYFKGADAFDGNENKDAFKVFVNYREYWR